MSSLGLKPTAVSDAIRFAVKHGFLVAKDSPTGKRYGRRTADGAIDVQRSFGFDLTPLSMRHAELAAIAQKHRTDHAARMAARRQVTREREALRQIIATAEEIGIWTTYWEDTTKRCEDSRTLLTPTRTLAEIEHIARCLANWRQEAHQMLEQAVQNIAPEALSIIDQEVESESRLS
ncbi:MAG: hypothetical protein EBV03_12740, partial [Proteobacteria bacterium]|nr:hypothetical protein [Pseudomonadota bacterium]